MCLALRASEEQGDSLGYAPIPRLLGLCAVDLIDVIALQAVGQPGEEAAAADSRSNTDLKSSGISVVLGSVATVRVTSMGSPPVNRVSLRTAALTLTRYVPAITPTVLRCS